ncbi:hypothetical protein Tco_1041055 [Tanacetum coccineum]|uniref:Uncharacterized protein n=1 Tax=Tanacetum coccineum TaxID=301880 RepID=A0ABQ5GF27_9ASTR
MSITSPCLITSELTIRKQTTTALAKFPEQTATAMASPKQDGYGKDFLNPFEFMAERPTKGFSGQEVALFPTMLDDTEPSPSPSRITSSPSPTPSPSPTQPSPTQPSPTQPSPSQPSPTQSLPTQPSPTHPGTEYHLPTPHDSPLHAVHSHGSDEGSLKLQELMNLIRLIPNKGRKLFDEEVQEKASTDTELFIQEMTPTEVIQNQEGSEKASDEVSTAGLKKERLSYAEAIRLEEQMNEEHRAQLLEMRRLLGSGMKKKGKELWIAAKPTKKIDWNDPSVIRYHSLKMKPKTIAQARRL